MAEYYAALIGCLRARGIAAELTKDGLGIAGLTDQQAFNDCQIEVGGPPAPPALTDDYLRRLYAFYLTSRDCLISRGYDVSQPPSYETWADGYRASFNGGDPADAWTPYTDVVTTSEQEAASINQACPQFMPEQ